MPPLPTLPTLTPFRPLPRYQGRRANIGAAPSTDAQSQKVIPMQSGKILAVVSVGLGIAGLAIALTSEKKGTVKDGSTGASRRLAFAQAAYSFLGEPHEPNNPGDMARWGVSNPELVTLALIKIGAVEKGWIKKLPEETAQAIYDASKPVPTGAGGEVGDLLFWGSGPNITHVGIVIAPIGSKDGLSVLASNGDETDTDPAKALASMHEVTLFTGADVDLANARGGFRRILN